jgi:pSer/pThr/pTyr-binding forkhead associated (FHA) protein
VSGVFCTNCGHRNAESSNFCSSCGAALTGGDDSTITIRAVEAEAPGTDEELVVNFEEVPEGAGVLVVRRGPNAGSKFLLDRPITQIGRHPESDIFLDDITVSRRHAELVRSGEGYTLKDAGSLNGTYLNRERVDESHLENGDEVQIGKFKLVFLAGA